MTGDILMADLPCIDGSSSFPVVPDIKNTVPCFSASVSVIMLYT